VVVVVVAAAAAAAAGGEGRRREVTADHKMPRSERVIRIYSKNNT